MKVLFVCEGNMFRSQIAEFFYNTATRTKDARSAGVNATLLDHASKRAETVMQELDMTLEGQRSDQVTEAMAEWADRIILFQVDEPPLFLKDNEKVEVWDVLDEGHGQEGETIVLDRRVRDEVKARVSSMLQEEREA